MMSFAKIFWFAWPNIDNVLVSYQSIARIQKIKMKTQRSGSTKKIVGKIYSGALYTASHVAWISA